MKFWPGVLFVLAGLLVLLGRKGMINLFTDMQQRDKLFASRDAALFQRINTVLFGVALLGFGLFDIFR